MRLSIVRRMLAAIALLLVVAACGDDDAPIEVAGGAGASATSASERDRSVAGETATGTPRANPTRTATATATPPPFAATCGIDTGRHDPDGRLIPPAPSAPPGPAGSVAATFDPLLLRTIRASLGDEVDAFGVVVVNLADGRYAELSPERTFYAASLYKLTVLYEVFRQRELGRLSFDETLLYTPFYAQYDLGTAPEAICTERSIARAVDIMITISENVSAVLLQDRVGAAAINQDMAALGLTGTTLGSDGVWTTPRDMALLLEAIATGRAVSAGASAEMLDLLFRQQIRGRVPAGLPAGVAVGNKTGDWPGYTHDVAIVQAPFGTYVIAALSEQGASSPFIELSAAVYRYFETGEVPPEPTPSPSPSATP